MYISYDGQRLYLRNWEYNSARIMRELVKIIENNGGEVKPSVCNRFAMVSNRTLDHAIMETREKLEKYERLEAGGNSNPARVEAIKKMRDDLERWEAFDNAPFRADHIGYIRFMLDGFEYYYQHDENPFFDFHFTKMPIAKTEEERRENNRSYYAENDKKEWLWDCFFSLTCSEEDVKEAAYMILNMLQLANPSRRAPIATSRRRY